MGLFTVVSLAAGVSVFMFGMLLIKYSLGECFGEKLRVCLSHFTKNRFSATLTGTLVTAALQSSSASSVLTAAFVDSGIIDLYTAFWIIVGANAGTSFTGLFTAVSVEMLAPAICIPGIILLSFTHKKKLNFAGLLLMGTGLLFVGMNMLGSASDGIRESSFAVSVLSQCSSPFSGILTGCFFTALLQSSSAVTALLQMLAYDGIIGLRQAYYIILGSNIGTCATCAIASQGLEGGAKKVALMHILYNFFGSLLFVVIAEIYPLPEMISQYSPDNIKMQIALINIIFNVLSAALVLAVPFPRGHKSKKQARSRSFALLNAK